MSDEFNHFDQIAENLDKALKDMAWETALKGVSYSANIAPKRSGFLAGSIYAKSQDKSTYGQGGVSPSGDSYLLPEVEAPADPYTAVISVGANYGEDVEEGTRHMPPHPYLGPGALQAQGDLEEALSNIEEKLGEGL